MTQLASYTASGQTAVKLVAPAGLFDAQPSTHELLHQAYLTQQANSRPNLAQTKGRSQVRGGGRKPWRQKGTSRARAGSIRSPIWRGGGVVFGPTTERNYSKKINRRQSQLALRQALSLKAPQVMVIAALPTAGKTAQLEQLLSKLGCLRRSLLVDTQISEPLRRASNNLATVKPVSAGYLSVKQVIDADHIVITKAGLDGLKERLGADK